MSQTASTRLRTAEIVLLIAIGGFAGANLRQFLAVSLPGLAGTFAANVLGCLALGFFAYEAELVGVIAEETGYVASTGFLSSFTTYSTFALETVQATPLLGVLNVVANYGVGFVAVLVGREIARKVAATGSES
ncbi:CrcB protein [Halopelagius inordinatus]|uniref:Fluoride-specific ion channel FluC n=1 Tax=Halopelagius inordinatus TaxID=553467 RepID=A0A1I2P254_9EURY|nr:CrcB family protein [Halopelagius inordinatus]SFG07531.1 CrcB protein [Halopelagius inordinatus]